MSDNKQTRSRGMGSTYLRGKTWWIKYYCPVPGGHAKCVYESAHTPKLDTAEKLLRKRLAKVDAAKERGEPVGPSIDRTTVGDIATMVLNDWRVRGKFRKHKWVVVEGRPKYVGVDAKVSKPLDHVATFFNAKAIKDDGGAVTRYEGGRRAASITADAITEFVRFRQQQGAANASINRALATVKRAFTLALRAGRVAHRPYIEMLPEENTREVYVEPAQFNVLARELERYPDVRDLVAFLWLTGWRTMAAQTLEWSDISADVIRLRAEHSKNKRAGEQALVGELAELIERRRTLRDLACPFVFHRNGQPIKSYTAAWRSACDRAGLGERAVVRHDLRRSCARVLIRAGVDEHTAMKFTVHQTSSMFRRYNVVAIEDISNAAKRRDEYLAAQSAATPKVVPLRKVSR